MIYAGHSLSCRKLTPGGGLVCGRPVNPAGRVKMTEEVLCMGSFVHCATSIPLRSCTPIELCRNKP